MVQQKTASALYYFNENNIPFDKNMFSEFKYGNCYYAELMANELASFFEKKFSILKTKKIIIFSSPYYYIKTSSWYLTNHLFYILKNKYNFSIEFDKINRLNTYPDDYGLMSKEERYQLISKDTYDFEKKPIEDGFLLFVDDVSITGTHQLIVENLIYQNNYQNDFMFLYYAKLNGDGNPKIESYLNNFKIQNYYDLIDLISKDYFNFTTRAIKYILLLGSNDFLDFCKSINQIKPLFLKEVYLLSIKNKYNSIKSFSENLNSLKKIIS
jgi:hypothetical protein